MLSINNIKPNKGIKKRSKRLGRGNGSGKGTYSGRGMNGQNSRAGGGVPPWFEGGQTPLFRRMPKLKGFSNAFFKKHYNLVNLSDLEKLATNGIKKVDKKVLLENNIINKKKLPIKLLGNGKLSSSLIVLVDKASDSAKNAVEKVGGKLEFI